MPSNKAAGDRGEQEVISLVKCPNCAKPLVIMPPNYPLYDVQCTGCSFRAQVKTNQSKPKAEIFGAGWEIINKVLKAGFTVPPLIANFRWHEQGQVKQRIMFYPFVPKANLKKHRLPPTAKRANYAMFNYVGLDKLPHFVVYEK